MHTSTFYYTDDDVVRDSQTDSVSAYPRTSSSGFPQTAPLRVYLLLLLSILTLWTCSDDDDALSVPICPENSGYILDIAPSSSSSFRPDYLWLTDTDNKVAFETERPFGGGTFFLNYENACKATYGFNKGNYFELSSSDNNSAEIFQIAAVPNGSAIAPRNLESNNGANNVTGVANGSFARIKNCPLIDSLQFLLQYNALNTKITFEQDDNQVVFLESNGNIFIQNVAVLLSLREAGTDNWYGTIINMTDLVGGLIDFDTFMPMVEHVIPMGTSDFFSMRVDLQTNSTSDGLVLMAEAYGQTMRFRVFPDNGPYLLTYGYTAGSTRYEWRELFTILPSSLNTQSSLELSAEANNAQVQINASGGDVLYLQNQINNTSSQLFFGTQRYVLAATEGEQTISLPELAPIFKAKDSELNRVTESVQLSTRVSLIKYPAIDGSYTDFLNKAFAPRDANWLYITSYEKVEVRW